MPKFNKVKSSEEAEDMMSDLELIGMEVSVISDRAIKKVKNTLGIVNGYLDEASE